MKINFKTYNVSQYKVKFHLFIFLQKYKSKQNLKTHRLYCVLTLKKIKMNIQYFDKNSSAKKWLTKSKGVLYFFLYTVSKVMVGV